MSSVAVHDNSIPLAPDLTAAHTEFRRLVTACAVFEPAQVRFSVTGGDRVRWLNGMITNNVRDLAPGHGVYGFLLNPQGHILGDLYAFNRDGSLIVETGSAQRGKVLATFDRYIIMDDVEVADVSDQDVVIGIAGPTASTVLRAVMPELPELKPLQFTDLSWRDRRLTAVRGDNPAVDSYELWVAPAQKDLLRSELERAGAKPASAPALEWLRIASGIPLYGQDIRERDLPQETEQQRALHFSKGCYIGQEIVERIRSRGGVHRTFTGFAVEGALPPIASKIQADGKDVGEVTSAAMLPTARGEKAVTLGYLRREFCAPGKQLQSAGAQLTVAKLPFTEIFATKD